MAEHAGRRFRITGWAVAIVALVGFVGFPMFDLAREVIGAGWSSVTGVIGSRSAWEPMINTVWTATAATALTLAIATPIAVATNSFRRRHRLVVLALMLSPMLIPPFVSALSWMAAYGPGGITDDVARVALPGLVGPFGVVSLLVVSAMPIAYVILAAALQTRQERDLVRAARIAGATQRTAMRTITLPLLRPALAGAGAITFIMSANSFGVPAVLGTPARFTTATTRLYRDLILSADSAAFDRVLVLAAFLAVVTVAVVALSDTSTRRPLQLRTEASGPRLQATAPHRAGWMIGLYFGLTTAFPLVALVLTSLTKAPGLTPLPPNWTLDSFRTLIGADVGNAFMTSLVLAASAASIVLLLGGLLVALERRSRSRTGTVVAMAFAVPGSVLAVGVLLAYGPWLRDSVLIILVAYVAKFWMLGHRPITGAAEAFSSDLFAAARVSGAGPLTATRTIVVPLLRPAFLAAWLVVFMFGLHELTISSLLHGPGTTTMAVHVLNFQQLGEQATMAALAVLLTAGAALVTVPVVWLWRRTGPAAPV